MKPVLSVLFLFAMLVFFPESISGQVDLYDYQTKNAPPPKPQQQASSSQKKQKQVVYVKNADRPVNSIRIGLMTSNLNAPDSSSLYPNDLSKFYVAYQRETVLLPGVYFGLGAELYKSGGRDNDRAELNMTYLSFPASLRVSIAMFYLKGGMHGAIRFSAQEYANGEQVPIAKGKYNSFDFGWQLGGGINFLGIFFGELRYTWGQSKITDAYRNRQFQLGGGIRF